MKETPKVVSYAKKALFMKTFTGQINVIVESFPSPHENITNRYKTKYNFKYELMKQNEAAGGSAQRLLQGFQCPGIRPKIFCCQFEIFSVFSKLVLFIPRFLTENLTLFCRTLFENNCLPALNTN